VIKVLQNKPPSSFCFNPGTVTEDGTTVIAQIVVTHSKAETMLLEMSVNSKHKIGSKSLKKHTQLSRQLADTRI
jgi:hypothetical protein